MINEIIHTSNYIQKCLRALASTNTISSETDIVAFISNLCLADGQCWAVYSRPRKSARNYHLGSHSVDNFLPRNGCMCRACLYIAYQIDAASNIDGIHVILYSNCWYVCKTNGTIS